jgi:AcrR family transcriptional regulator
LENHEPEPGAARPGTGRRLRADGRRNYERLVAEARLSFEEQGAGASLDGIARRAGVANATLYRHFPTRSDLLVAVFSDEVDALLRLGDAMAQVHPAGTGLERWLLKYAEHVASKQELSRALNDGDGGSGLIDGWRRSMQTAAASLLSRAQDQGAVRPDIDVTDVLTVASGIAVTAASREQRERLLAIFLDGLQPRGR